MHFRNLAAVTLAATLFHALPVIAAGDLGTEFSNQGTIANTRHNLTQRQASGGPSGAAMDSYRNNYGQVCVYCHTPHGANADIAVPLWNRTVKATSYVLYNQGSLSGTVTQPGANSLSCLSCHDGQTAMDAIVNMPGAGGYSVDASLSKTAWVNSDGNTSTLHLTLTECLSCHSPAGGIPGQTATDFSVALIGTDLTNDHPVGVKLPTGEDWNVPGGTKNNIKYFDANGDNALSKGDIRFYDTGEGAEVECASCHDPHGVPSGTASSTFNLTFLRVSNTGSAVCLTCHNK
jgi:mono/diheme cytochrome c family protein